MKNFILWGVKKGQPDYTESAISDRQCLEKITNDIKWAVNKQYHHMKLYTYDERRPDEMKLIRNID